jgi:hypothetical protein
MINELEVAVDELNEPKKELAGVTTFTTTFAATFDTVKLGPGLRRSWYVQLPTVYSRVDSPLMAKAGKS